MRETPDVTKIRNAPVADAEAVSRVLAASWRHAYRGIVSQRYLDAMPDTRWVDFLAQGVGNDTFRCYAAERDGRIVGAAVIRSGEIEKLPGHGEMSCLYILPEYMGEGIGGALLERVLSYMKGAGLGYCVLDVLADNANAIAFYRKRGFEMMDMETYAELGGQKYKCMVMRKTLE